MKKEEFKYKKLNLKAEVILAEVLESGDGMQEENMVLSSDGGFNHRNRRAIAKYNEIQHDDSEVRYIFSLARRGLFDVLPEGLTYIKKASNNSTSEKKAAQLIQDIKRKKAEEKASRKFLAPFDQIFNGYKLKVELEEREVLGATPTGAKHYFYQIMWGENHHFLNDLQRSTLFSILPLAHEISANTYLMALAFESILNVEVVAEKSYKNHSYHTSTAGLKLSEYKLGEDFVLNQEFEQFTPTYTLNIGPIPKKEAFHFLPNQRHSETLNLLRDYFTPFDVEVEYIFNYETDQLFIEKKAAGSSNRLGCTIHI